MKIGSLDWIRQRRLVRADRRAARRTPYAWWDEATAAAVDEAFRNIRAYNEELARNAQDLVSHGGCYSRAFH